MNALKIVAISFSFYFLFSCSTRRPQFPLNVNLTKGLIAYYPFNSNTNDESGNDNTGYFVNGSSLTYDENGRPNAALNCNGEGQKLVIHNNGKIKLDTAMTISFHVMPRTINRCNIIGMSDNATAKGTSFVIGPALPGNDNLIYSLTNNEVTCDAWQTSSQVSNIDGGIILQPESWYNVVCSYFQGKMKLYVNGVLIKTISSQNNTMHVCPNSELLVGGWWVGDPSASFNGKIDEVRLYNRELNFEEINELTKSFK